MTTYPPTPGPPEPEPPEPERRGDDEGAEGSGPNAESAPGPPRGGTPGETPRAPSDEPPSPPSPSIPPAPPPPGAGPTEPPPLGGGYSPYAGGAVPPPPPAPPAYNGDGPLYAQQPRNGLGTAALVCGIVAVALSFVPVLNWFTWPVGVLAIVFGAVGWSRANKAQATNKSIAITGLALGILSFFTFCLIYIVIAGGSSVYYDAAPML